MKKLFLCILPIISVLAVFRYRYSFIKCVLKNKKARKMFVKMAMRIPAFRKIFTNSFSSKQFPTIMR